MLDFCGQKWKPQKDGDLTLFLPRKARGELYFDCNFSFVPPWLEDEDYDSEHRTLNVDVRGYIPPVDDWQALAGVELETREAIELPGGTMVPGMEGPAIKIWSSGGTGSAASIHTHARDGWETRLKLVDFAESIYVFDCEVEAFYPSQRAREASAELVFKEFIGESDWQDWEKKKLLEEGWRFSYTGRLRLEHLSCTVPLNTPDPIGWAQAMARRELKMTRFGFSYVCGGELDGRFKPEDGVTPQGRLVLLAPPSASYYQWLEHQKRKKGEQGRAEE